MEALNEHNRILVSLAAQTNEQLNVAHSESAMRLGALDSRVHAMESRMEAMGAVIDQVDLLKSETIELKDIRKHWIEWRADWERKLSTNEIQFLRSAADLQGAFQHRVTLIESNFRDLVKSQHGDYLTALDRTTIDIQRRLWEDLNKIRADYDRLIHTELRLIRQRAVSAPPPPPQASTIVALPQTAPDFDYARFAERFRGSEDYVRRNQEFYKPFFAGRSNVLDIGCGRGEFLETMRDLGVPARGIDLKRRIRRAVPPEGLFRRSGRPLRISQQTAR